MCIQRLLKRYRKRSKLKGRSYTKSGTLLKSQIPIRTFSEWDENKVGFKEIDLVGHDGGVVRLGSQIKKVHDKPTTPYRRVLRAKDLSKEVKDKLRAQYKTLNLVNLKEKIDEVLKRLKPTKIG